MWGKDNNQGEQQGFDPNAQAGFSGQPQQYGQGQFAGQPPQFGQGQFPGDPQAGGFGGGYQAPQPPQQPAYAPQPQFALPFTSDLSGQAFWLIRDQGYIPVGFVLGNSVYSMGVSGGIKSAFKGLVKGEVREMTQLMYDARRNALERMKAEAAQLGADGIIGVNLMVVHHGDLMEVTATGTAVRRDPNHNGESRAQVVLDASNEQGGASFAV